VQTVLGIESSCDETAAAVVRGDARAGKGTILSNIVFDQMELHAAYGGVVPEIAARAHAEKLDIAVARALEESGLALDAIDAIAVTVGPGLIGGLIAGIACAQGLALGSGKPLVAVNHLEGHALTPRLTDGLAYPYLMLLVSGGHCLFLIVRGPDDHERIGTTIDDAPGEAFDKTAKMLNLGIPGGPRVEAMARTGDPARFTLPRPLLDRPGCDLSFSGLKTAVRMARDKAIAVGGMDEQGVVDLCAAFQVSVRDVLVEKSRRAMARFSEEFPDSGQPAFAIAGGVAANGVLREGLHALAAREGFSCITPPLSLCTDNGAMIAWAGLERHAIGLEGELVPRPRFPIASNPLEGIWSGKRGAKA
jgi:N6-L-threonylcarbamoyladenine synthase